MPNPPKLKTTSRFFSEDQVAAALAAAGPPAPPTGIDWKKAIITHGGGTAATVAEIRRVRGKSKLPTKESVALRIDPDVLAAFRADGPGWQTRMNAVLRKWVESQAKPRRRVAAKTDA
jgi:uncharacterized protein (DUF4415 family)